MKNLWITSEEKMNSTQPKTIPNGYPQSYAQVLANNLGYLTTFRHTIHEYNSIKQQHYCFIRTKTWN
jgi:hypothetical protein